MTPRKKRWLSVLGVLTLGALVVALYDPSLFWSGLKAVGRFFKQVGIAVEAYAKTAGPFSAGLALCLIGFFDSSFTPVPEGNDILVVYFSIHHPAYMLWFVLASTVGSLLGSFILFAMGRRGGEILVRRHISEQKYRRFAAWFRRRGFWAVFVPCIIPPPMPFKLFVLTAGVLRLSWPVFTLATTLGRIVRYGIWGVLTVIYRDEILYFMKHHMLQVGLVICGVIFVLLMASWAFSRFLRRDPAAAASPGAPAVELTETEP